jgi:hypothetical protein
METSLTPNNWNYSNVHPKTKAKEFAGTRDLELQRNKAIILGSLYWSIENH